MTENFRNIIAIGASAGGINAIMQLLSGLPADIDASIVAVLHLSQESNAQNIVDYFSKNTRLHCQVAEDEISLEKGHVYLAPENRHVLSEDGVLLVNYGAREHRYRPSIDVLFRSVAVNYRSRAIGVILSGMLDDGTSGMYAIKKCGGICIVQEPDEAEYDQMPMNVVERVDVDYKAPLDKISKVLSDVLSKPLPPEIPIPEDLRTEAKLTQNLMTSIDNLKQIGERTDLTCPDCGGGLWSIKGDPSHRYRCHTGHVFSEKLLYDLQGVNLEESVWVSIRMLEERKNLLDSMARHSEKNQNISSEHKQDIRELEKHIQSLKYLLKKLMEDRERA